MEDKLNQVLQEIRSLRTSFETHHQKHEAERGHAHEQHEHHDAHGMHHNWMIIIYVVAAFFAGLLFRAFINTLIH